MLISNIILHSDDGDIECLIRKFRSRDRRFVDIQIEAAAVSPYEILGIRDMENGNVNSSRIDILASENKDYYFTVHYRKCMDPPYDTSKTFSVAVHEVER